MLNQTPSAFRQLLTAQDARTGQKSYAAVHQLRYVIFGGEALELSSLEGWYRNPLNTQTQLVNMYGITETTVHTTYHPLTADDVHRAGPSPIGRQLADLRLYILDKYCQPVPMGVTGELYIGGAGVARGISIVPNLLQNDFWLIRLSVKREERGVAQMKQVQPGCINPVIWAVGWQMAPWNIWAGTMIR
ncbi:AMP-binding protein [Vibrio sp. PP-XX7]